MASQRDENMDMLEVMKDSCSQDWKELRQLQAKLSQEQSQQSETQQRYEIPSAESLLQAKEKRCRAELAYLRQHPVEKFPDVPSIQAILLERDQKKRLQQLQETLTYLRAKRQDLLNELDTEKNLNENLRKMNTALKEKLKASELQAASPHEDAVEGLINDVSERLTKAKKEDAYFKRQLRELLTNHFSLPNTPGTISTVFNESRDFNTDEALPLKTVLGLLIEQTMHSPAQPYVDIDERFWPPIVEFLLKSQIALKDPNNPNRLRLVPFYM